MDDLFWEIYQHGKVLSAKAGAEDAVAHSQRTRGELGAVEAKIDRLALLCHAMWELVRDRHGLDEANLMQKVRELDLRDGILDGKLSSHPRPCIACQRIIGSREEYCIYCGASNPVGSAFHAR